MSATLVFTTRDIRKYILSIRGSIQKSEYIKRIYKSWVLKPSGLRMITTLPNGVSHTDDTLSVTWSISSRKLTPIDNAPIIITDNVRIDNGSIQKYDAVIDVSYHQVKTQGWFIPLDRYSEFSVYYLHDYYGNMVDFTGRIHDMRNTFLINELYFRKHRCVDENMYGENDLYSIFD